MPVAACVVDPDPRDCEILQGARGTYLLRCVWAWRGAGIMSRQVACCADGEDTARIGTEGEYLGW